MFFSYCRLLPLFLCPFAWVFFSPMAIAITGEEVQARIDADLAQSKPITIHVIVALCDNKNQGIVKVPALIGNGQDPRNNLYWGALYGVNTHLTRKGGWKKVEVEKPANMHILDRAVFYTSVKRNGQAVPVYIVADAWDGAQIKASLQRFLEFSAGHIDEPVTTFHNNTSKVLQAGSASHLVGFIGHNGLMDFALGTPTKRPNAPARSAFILACKSKPYFEASLQKAGAHPLLLTTGFMAPEAYTVDSAIRTWASAKNSDSVREAAAQAYHQYQKCGMNGARRLFWGAP